MVEHFLAKEDVASSSLVTRSPLHYQRIAEGWGLKVGRNTNKLLTKCWGWGAQLACGRLGKPSLPGKKSVLFYCALWRGDLRVCGSI